MAPSGNRTEDGDSVASGPESLDVRRAKPFHYLSNHSTLAPELSGLIELIETHPVLRRAEAGARKVRDIHAEIKPVRSRDGTWKLDRFYWSLQAGGASPDEPFSAYTLTFTGAKGAAWTEFPDDSYLPGMSSWFREASSAAAGRVHVLRYVPLRRFTFRTKLGDTSVIGKIKRKSRYREAWSLLRIVDRAVTMMNAPFAVARPLHLNDERALYLQSALPGRDLLSVIDATNDQRLLARVGELHASLHRILPPRELATRKNSQWANGAATDVEMIAFLNPRQCKELEVLPSLLQRQMPPEAPNSFCHGDFVCSQLLVEEDRWSITDFDLCHAGDRYRDIAMFLASLPHEFEAMGSARHTVLSEAYLEGYQTAAGARLDRQRLYWHRIAAELYHLALALRKGRFVENTFASGATTALDLAAQLSDH